jgi:FixJ family two-component response regulator
MANKIPTEVVPNWNLKGKVIAVVDDHAPLREAMRGLIEAYGAEVLTYQSGNDFLQKIPFIHCLVVDYYMPRLDGLDLISELRKQGYSMPVIILTGVRDEIPEARMAGLEVMEVVDKWLGADVLLGAIHRYAT